MESVYMGWPRKKPLGKVFAGIKAGDSVLIAYGSMLNNGKDRRLIACGRVKSVRPVKDPAVPNLGHSQYARLDPLFRSMRIHSRMEFL